MDLIPDKLICASQQLRSKKDDRGRSVSDLLVLLRCQRDEDPGLVRQSAVICGQVSDSQRVRDLDQRQYCGAVVGDGDIAYIVYQHLIKTAHNQPRHTAGISRGTDPTGPSEDLRTLDTV